MSRPQSRRIVIRSMRRLGTSIVGLLLDSTVIISAERRGSTARQLLQSIATRFPGEPVAISVLTLLELAHGVARADSPERRANRQFFLLDLAKVLPAHSITPAIALRAGRIDGECAGRGVRIALSDLLIAVTALELGYGIATANLRHFQLVPGLRVVSF
jgi:tRNA(fMet)-specific endonuclease VapC